MIKIRIPGEPARKTEQQHRYGGTGRNGRAIIYRDAKLEAVRQELLTELMPYRPDAPLKGPVSLMVTWSYGTSDLSKIHAHWKTTRPDTDNLVKLLKDCLTEAGFWQDDSQVVAEHLFKKWVPRDQASTYIAIEEDPES